MKPLSTTNARYPAGKRSRTQGSAAASFKQGKITSIVMSVTLNTRAELDQPETLSVPLQLGRISKRSGCGGVEFAYADWMSARVLVVEDDETMASVLSAYLTQAGYEAVLAPDGTEALTAWSRVKPDVVILDISLPEMD